MKHGFASFDEYWSVFVRDHWRPSTRNVRLARSTVALVRAAVARLVPRFGWPAAATLLAWVKTLTGTIDRDIDRATQAAAWPPLRATAALEGAPPPPRAEPDRARDWAVWL